MEKIKLEAKLRAGTGTQVAKKIRQKGLVPGIIYGKGENIAVELEQPAIKTLRKSRFSETILWEMEVVDKDKRSPVSVLIKDVQYHPVTDSALHIDFMRVSLTEKIRVHIPIILTGTAQKVVLAQGLVSQILHELEVEGLPLDLPEKIEVDVSAMDIGNSIHASDIKLPANLRITTNAQETIVTAVEKQEEEIVAQAAAEGAPAAEPEVIKEKKDKEGEADGKSEAKPAAKSDAKPEAKADAKPKK